MLSASSARMRITERSSCHAMSIRSGSHQRNAAAATAPSGHSGTRPTATPPAAAGR
jgi:hypothetical protein